MYLKQKIDELVLRLNEVFDNTKLLFYNEVQDQDVECAIYYSIENIDLHRSNYYVENEGMDLVSYGYDVAIKGKVISPLLTKCPCGTLTYLVDKIMYYVARCDVIKENNLDSKNIGMYLSFNINDIVVSHNEVYTNYTFYAGNIRLDAKELTGFDKIKKIKVSVNEKY